MRWPAVLGVLVAAAVGGGALASASASAPRDTKTLLVVGLGDSLSSGEGNPDVPKSGNKPAQWQSRRCDRSNKSYQAQVADRLQAGDKTAKLTFVYLACSGATILDGLLGPYAGVNPELPKLPAQVEEARRLAGGRKADAVMLSIGVNDLEFGKVATFCAGSGKTGYCPDMRYRNGLTLAQWMKQQLDALPARYDKLATALEPLVAADHLFITEYPDLVSVSPQQLCKLIYFRPGVLYGDYEIKEKEVDWLYHNFYLPLNAEIRAAAKKHGWSVIDAPSTFESHGYCVDDSWIVSYKQSNDGQGDANGTLHPNFRGQTEIADAFFPVVAKAIQLPGRRPPRGSKALIVVGLGDSLSSGEGNPDVPRTGSQPAQWQNRRCDRSNNSYEAQAADRLMSRKKTTVRFVYLACSGSTIEKGLLGPYAGVNPPTDAPDLPAQVQEARRIVGQRKADAVMLSIGVNDLGFGQVASFCAFLGGALPDKNCADAEYKGGLTLAQWMKQQLLALPAKYDRLAEALDPLVAAGHVFITEYPDLVSESPAALCQKVTFGPGLEITQSSVDWLYHHFYLPLNARIRAVATEHGWNTINAPPAFEKHGYCTADSWIVSFQQSNERQGDASGTLHPNLRGQGEIADAFYPVVSRALTSSGRPAPARPKPGRPTGGLG